MSGAFGVAQAFGVGQFYCINTDPTPLTGQSRAPDLQGFGKRSDRNPV